jgi:hypothetical protein
MFIRGLVRKTRVRASLALGLLLFAEKTRAAADENPKDILSGVSEPE